MYGWTGHNQDNEAEPLPAAETGEAELGPPSKFTSTLRRATEIWVTATFAAESVRGRKAECAVQRQILSPGGSGGETRPADEAASRRWRSAPIFASARALRKPAKRKRVRGKEFLSRVCAQKWVPPKMKPNRPRRRKVPGAAVLFWVGLANLRLTPPAERWGRAQAERACQGPPCGAAAAAQASAHR